MELDGYFWQSDFILHVGSLCFTVCVLVQGAKDAVTGDRPEEGEKGAILAAHETRRRRRRLSRWSRSALDGFFTSAPASAETACSEHSRAVTARCGT